MKHLYLFILLALPLNLYSQCDSISYSIFSFSGSEDNPFIIDSLVYFDNKDSVKHFIKKSDANGPVNLSGINFEENGLILVPYQGTDCHSKFDFTLYRDFCVKEYVLSLKIIYGGCRAGGMKQLRWLKIPKLPEGYKTTYRIYYDDKN